VLRPYLTFIASSASVTLALLSAQSGSGANRSGSGAVSRCVRITEMSEGVCRVNGSQFRLDCVGYIHRTLQLAFSAHELTCELVTRHHLLNRDAPLDGCGDAMVIFNIEARPCLHGD
jgi:hypothetical protein